MKLQLDYSLSEKYQSKTQQMRVITEHWAEHNLFCPICGQNKITRYKANRPVADFFCGYCNEEFELKSKNQLNDIIPNKITDGAYDTMVSRLRANNNPHFFFLIHNQIEVRNLLLIPKYYITPDYIEKRPPLSPNARRAGWIGCNINLSHIPKTGLIYIVKDGYPKSQNKVLEEYDRAQSLNTTSIYKRSWLMEVLKCVECTPGKEFSLKQIYANSDNLHMIFRKNNNVEAKIRQQLQILRDKGIIEFVQKGLYRKRW